MQKYSTKTERENIRTLLLSDDIENVKLGLSLLESLPRYKYFKSKILYRHKMLHFRTNTFNPISLREVRLNFIYRKSDMYYTNAKKSVEDLIKRAKENIKKEHFSGALEILAKALIKYERVF